MKIKIIAAFILLMSDRSYSQSLSSNIFNVACDELVKKNEYWRVYQWLQGCGKIVTDVREDKAYFIFSDSCGVEKKNLFNSYDNTAQQGILSAVQLPIFPLADTIFLVDSIRLFSYGMTVNRNGYFFQQVLYKSDYDRPNVQYIYVRKATIHNDELYVSFNFENSEYGFGLVFRLNDKVEFLRFKY